MYTKRISIVSLTLLTFLLSSVISLVVAINHLVVKNDGNIMQRLDSPFFMREPGNLLAFLDQIRYNEYVETSFMELLRKREKIVEHLRFSVQFGVDLVDQAKCAMDFYLMENRMSYLTPASLKRLDLPVDIHEAAARASGEPNCHQAATIVAGPSSYAHLESFQADIIRGTRVDREEDSSMGVPAIDVIRRIAVHGLSQMPNSWKYHTISSYYWRIRGEAQQAIECARLAVMFAPRSHKDIPLLSLGTIIFRAGRLSDSDVLITAAVEHAPDEAANHLALASALAMKHDFNRSLYHFDEAERLDPGLLPQTQPVRNFIGCLDNLRKKTTKMYSYIEFMKNEVKEFKNLKSQISQHHEKLTQQQVPLGARYLDTKTNNEDLVKRGQYCSTLTLSAGEEPILFCDFYSDLQMRLESNDVDIEALERDLKSTSEAVIEQVSTIFRKQLSFQQQVKSTDGQAPAMQLEGRGNSETNSRSGKTT